MKEGHQINIGTLAKATGTKVVTVRYYEKIGLLPVPSRSSANYRSYSERDLFRLSSSGDAGPSDSHSTKSASCFGFRPTVSTTAPR